MPTTMVYLLGVATGAALVAYHRARVSAAVNRTAEQCRYEKEQISDQLRFVTDQRNDLAQERALNEAYWTGYEKGQLSPLSDAERLVKVFQGRNVQFINTSRN